MLAVTTGLDWTGDGLETTTISAGAAMGLLLLGSWPPEDGLLDWICCSDASRELLLGMLLGLRWR